MKRWLRVIQREELLASRWLQPFARHLSSPSLWRINRRGMARGIGLGLFAAFAVPLAQTPAAAVLAAVMRANLPVAAAATFVTNPLTMPIFYPLAYLLGSRMLHTPPEAILAFAPNAGMIEGFLGWLVTLAGPTYLGLLVFAMVSAAAGFFITHFSWGLRVRYRRRVRLERRIASHGLL